MMAGGSSAVKYSIPLRVARRGAWFALRLLRIGRLAPHAFVVERLENPLAEPLLELEQDLDAGEVHPPVASQMTNPLNPSDVLVAVESDVGRGSGRAEQALVLVDPQGSRMDGDDSCGDADDIDRPPRILVWPAEAHVSARLPRGLDDREFGRDPKAVRLECSGHGGMLEP